MNPAFPFKTAPTHKTAPKLLGHTALAQAALDIVEVCSLTGPSDCITYLDGRPVVDIKKYLTAIGRSSTEVREVKNALTNMGVPRNPYRDEVTGTVRHHTSSPYGAPVTAVCVYLDDFASFYSRFRKIVFGNLTVEAMRVKAALN
ncbi:TPA: hypothetical protein QDA91_001939 [Burkholderia vietnamiensis]|nr:hypothetical protein [Burkholderia vietnamiensis]